MGAKPTAEIDYNAAINHAADMPTRELERRCARTAGKAGKFLASAYAIIEPELAYFLELRYRLNAQGKRGVEGWARWCEKHFSCCVRTVNRALSSLLGPEKERKSFRKWRAPAEALIAATAPAMRLAQRHPEDPDANDFLSSLDTEELSGLVPEPPPRFESYVDKLQRDRLIKKEELYEMGLHLAEAVAEAPNAIRGGSPEGKKILGIAKQMLQKKPFPRQDKVSRSGNGFVVDEDDGIRIPPQKSHKANGVKAREIRR